MPGVQQVIARLEFTNPVTMLRSFSLTDLEIWAGHIDKTGVLERPDPGATPHCRYAAPALLWRRSLDLPARSNNRRL